MDEEMGAFDRIAAVIKAIPRGEVMGYGEVALAAGFPRGARTVVWVLKTRSEKDGLPWHRVVRQDRRIATPFSFRPATQDPRNRPACRRKT